ncbi:MAG: glucose-6-phosphate isomerase, partial [Anaerolineales bacterium]|nr:glucose-6-phosphate isomerase [Anaerolineales bacterium]
MSNLTTSPAWQALVQHQQAMTAIHMRDLFAEDNGRFSRFSLHLGDDLLFDYSKNRITDETMALLLTLVEQAGLAEAIKAMFSGAKINNTEQRAVLH